MFAVLSAGATARAALATLPPLADRSIFMPVRRLFSAAACVSVCGGASPGGEGGTGCRPIEFVSLQSQALTNSGWRTFFPVAFQCCVSLARQAIFLLFPAKSTKFRSNGESGFPRLPTWPTPLRLPRLLASLKSCIKDETAEITGNVSFRFPQSATQIHRASFD